MTPEIMMAGVGVLQVLGLAYLASLDSRLGRVEGLLMDRGGKR